MKLYFTNDFNGRKTNFLEKIFAAFKHLELTEEMASILLDNNNPMDWKLMIKTTPKIHTVRTLQNPFARLCRKNEMIQPYVILENGTHFQFHPTFKSTNIALVSITYTNYSHLNAEVTVNGKKVNFLEFAKNEGFYSVNEFLDFFDKDFTGILIQWTDFRY